MENFIGYGVVALIVVLIVTRRISGTALLYAFTNSIIALIWGGIGVAVVITADGAGKLIGVAMCAYSLYGITTRLNWGSVWQGSPKPPPMPRGAQPGPPPPPRTASIAPDAPPPAPARPGKEPARPAPPSPEASVVRDALEGSGYGTLERLIGLTDLTPAQVRDGVAQLEAAGVVRSESHGWLFPVPDASELAPEVVEPVRAAVAKGADDLEFIVVATGLPVAEVLAALHALEATGSLRRYSNGAYRIPTG